MASAVKLEWAYSVVFEKGHHTDIGEYSTYSIKVIGSQRTKILHDVSIEKEEVGQMVELFNRYQLSDIHLQDAVSDMLI